MMILDELDRALLRHLREDARQSFRTLARKVDSTVPTVAARIRRMEELDIIQGYSVIVDPERFGGGPVTMQDVDLNAPVAVQCHTCKQETVDPFWAHVEGSRHPFCCTQCKKAFLERYEQMAKALQ